MLLTSIILLRLGGKEVDWESPNFGHLLVANMLGATKERSPSLDIWSFSGVWSSPEIITSVGLEFGFEVLGINFYLDCRSSCEFGYTVSAHQSSLMIIKLDSTAALM